MTIRCNNPSCGAQVSVPEGAQYVMCSSCNTYLFVSDFENQVQQGSQNQGGYGVPESVEPPPYSSGAAYNPPPFENNPSYQPTNDIFQSETPVFVQEPKPVQPEAAGALGILVMPDGRQFQLKVGRNTIGRKEGDFLINDSSVSRKHCIVEVSPRPEGGGWNYFVSDIGLETGVGSLNGVFISNRSVRLENFERIPISHQIIIQLGTVRMMLHIP